MYLMTGHSVRMLGQKKESGKKVGGASLNLPKIRKNPLIEIIAINTGWVTKIVIDFLSQKKFSGHPDFSCMCQKSCIVESDIYATKIVARLVFKFEVVRKVKWSWKSNDHIKILTSDLVFNTYVMMDLRDFLELANITKIKPS